MFILPLWWYNIIDFTANSTSIKKFDIFNHIDYHQYIMATHKHHKVEEPVCTRCFNTLGVSSRMKIYRFLRDSGENTVNTVVDLVRLTQPTVSYHLKEMKDCGILKSRKSGKEVYYSVDPDCPVYLDECVLHKVQFPGEAR